MGLVLPAPLFGVNAISDQSQVFESSILPNVYVKLVDMATISVLTGKRSLMSVAISLGFILLFFL